MPSFLDTRDADFAARFQALLEGKRESSQEVGDTVAGIIADVRARGDEALVELTNKFDKANVTAETLRFSEAEIEEAAARVTPDVRSALETAHARIKAHHEKQKPVDHIYTDEIGVTLGTRWTAIEAVGIYVPGGLAS
jgi:histidinol dehydrogenase